MMDAALEQPADLVARARALMESPHTPSLAAWSRAAALLGRQALEAALDQLWLKTAPGMERASRRAQLICLSEYLAHETATRARYAWHGLSDACHHHAYELAPVAAELKGWLADVHILIAAITAEEFSSGRNVLRAGSGSSAL